MATVGVEGQLTVNSYAADANRTHSSEADKSSRRGSDRAGGVR